ncbi:hypothetical protein MMC30_002251 [Trapelia coarctata]|nr:hypothetical protein [Trapelia coarctata]
MAPFRNPFGRRPPPVNGSAPSGQDESAPSTLPNGTANASQRDNLSTTSRTSSALSIKPNREEPNEFKLSVVNDSGVYLPPSPPDKKSFWRRTPTSTTSSSHRSALSENEPFSISRESFDSYRRSFDISARSPITHADTPTSARQSLDSSLRSPRTPRSALTAAHFKPPQPTSEEAQDAPFEDVNLNSSAKPPSSNPSSHSNFHSHSNATPTDDPAKPKRRSLFARFGDSADPSASTSDADKEGGSRPGSSHRGFHLPGRKRGQSGQGSELGQIPKPVAVAGPREAVGTGKEVVGKEGEEAVGR